MKEKVNHPAHYNQYPVETIDMMVSIWGRDAVKTFCEINAFKYRMRAGLKGDAKTDFEKEKVYLEIARSLSGVPKPGEKKDPTKLEVFLKREGIFELFKSRINSRWDIFNNERGNDAETIIIGKDFGGFDWVDTKEGAGYWNEIDDNYRRFFVRGYNKLERFLFDNNALGAFKKCYEADDMEDGTYDEYVQNHNDASNAISHAFHWLNCGIVLWSDLNDRWKEILKK